MNEHGCATKTASRKYLSVGKWCLVADSTFVAQLTYLPVGKMTLLREVQTATQEAAERTFCSHVSVLQNGVRACKGVFFFYVTDFQKVNQLAVSI
jgi:hypothetical protein